MKNFYRDAAAAKPAELLVLNTFAALAPNWEFQHVGANKDYYHIGDIIATHKESGKIAYIEVKNDASIANTHNVLCEESNYFYDGGYQKGNMNSNYQYYCVVSQQERIIYVCDFSILKKYYKNGKFSYKYHDSNISYFYLLPLTELKALGGLLYVVEY